MVTMLEFRKNVQSILRHFRKRERFVLSHRGQTAARLEPIASVGPANPANDPFVTIGRRALPSPKGKTKHSEIDRILYGGS